MGIIALAAISRAGMGEPSYRERQQLWRLSSPVLMLAHSEIIFILVWSTVESVSRKFNTHDRS